MGIGERVDGCYACEQTARLGGELAFRERVVVRDGWRVAVDFNSRLPGWLVVLPLQHVEALDELTPEQAAALGPLLREATAALRAVTGCVKTYVMAFGEADGFAHLHLHVVPRMADIPEDHRGPNCFAYHRDPGPPPSEAERDALATRLAAVWPTAAATHGGPQLRP